MKYRPTSLDPIESVDEASGIVLSVLHRRLYRLGPYGRIEGDLVKKETIKENKAILELEKAEFKNQEEFSSEDVVFSLNRLKNSGRQEWVLKDLEEIYAPKKDQVVLQFKGNSWESLKARLSLPKTSIYSKKAFLENGGFLGLSPYTLVHYSPEKVVFSSLKNTVEFFILPDEATRYFFYKKDKLTIYEADGPYRNLPFDETQYFIYDITGLAVLYGAIVEDGFLLSNKEFRLNLNHFFDRKNFCEKVVLGACKASEVPVPEELGGKMGPKFSSKGKKIPKYGPKKNYEIWLYTPPDRERQNLSRLVQDLLAQMQISSKIITLDLPSLIRYNNEKRPGIYFFKWLSDYPHPENFLEPLFHSQNQGMGGNRAYYNNPKVDKLLENTNYSVKDIEKIQKIIQNDAPWLFVGHIKKRYLIKKGQFRPEPMTYFWDWKSYFLNSL